MKYSRQEYMDFLESEFQAQNDDFLKKLETPAIEMLESSGDVFLGKFLRVRGGIMILKMSSKRSLPRKGTYLNCLALPSQLRNYKNWGRQTYGQLINQQECHTEAVCIWYGKAEEDHFSLVGFRGVDCDFARRIEGAGHVILVLGPHIPPFEFLKNLQDLALSAFPNKVLDYDFQPHEWRPTLLDGRVSVAEYLLQQLSLSDEVALQGPPGTGKTTIIAQICDKLLREGKSVLVTALTNRALMEAAGKSELEKQVLCGRVAKTNLSIDEQSELPLLGKASELLPVPGRLLLSTFFIASSGVSDSSCELPFDYVVMDEASQAILPMFAAAKQLGKKMLYIGDIKQLPPVLQTNADKITRRGWQPLASGFQTICEGTTIPNFMLSTSYRLSARSAEYTAFFYEGHLHSSRESGDEAAQIENNGNAIVRYQLPTNDGPLLVETDLPIGDRTPSVLCTIAEKLVGSILATSPRTKIAVLSCFVATVRKLLQTLSAKGLYGDNLLIDTVARVQGLTADVTIFVIPNTFVFRSLEPRLFNVATSRSRVSTIIIADKTITSMAKNPNVRKYLQKLELEASIYLPMAELNMLETIACRISSGDFVTRLLR